jgi:exosortase/archaeosortase family protein
MRARNLLEDSVKKPRRVATHQKPVLFFLVRCLVYWGIALLLVSKVPAVEEAGIDLTLRTLQGVLALFHQQVERHGSSLFAGGTSVDIVSECSPHMPFLIFAAVILAFPASWRQRLTGLGLGAVVIHVFNTIRILTLIWVLSARREWFEFIHVYLWQTGTIVIVFVTFALWIGALGRGRKAAQAA